MSKKKITVDSLTKNAITKELNRVKYKSKYNGLLRNTIYTLIIIIAIGAILVSLFMPVLEISGDSMNPKYLNGDIVVTFKTKNIHSGDIIAFYYGNKILVKRVIATEGNWVNISDKGDITINGEKLKEDYVIHKKAGDYSTKFPCQVKTDSYFVLSDDRNNIIDSRNEDIGLIHEDDIVGKVLFRIWPFR